MEHQSWQDDRICLVIDQLQLRRAGLVNLLTMWAAEVRLELRALAPSALSSSMLSSASVGLIVLNIGSESVENLAPSTSIAALQALLPEVPVVIISDRTDADETLKVFHAGARGHLPTSMLPEIAIRALSFILAGGSFFPPAALLHSIKSNGPNSRRIGRMSSVPFANKLTIRQNEILELLHHGMPNKLIARQLNVRESTVKVHIRTLFKRLGVQNRTEAALITVASRVATT
jgi:DNA-binding NarL/FixJ family response regulator